MMISCDFVITFVLSGLLGGGFFFCLLFVFPWRGGWVQCQWCQHLLLRPSPQTPAVLSPVPRATSSLLWRRGAAEMLRQSQQREQKTLCSGAEFRVLFIQYYLLKWKGFFFTLKRIFFLLLYLYQNRLTYELLTTAIGLSKPLRC